METLEKNKVYESDLQELGFTKAAKQLEEKRELARKMRIAFEHFTVITPEAVKAFQDKLMATTKRIYDKHGSYTYQYLAFIPIGNYEEVPPPAALEALRAAKQIKCFDHFMVGKILESNVSQVPIPDPLLLGGINGDPNYYFIAQWDDDVKIEDILRPEEIL